MRGESQRTTGALPKAVNWETAVPGSSLSRGSYVTVASLALSPPCRDLSPHRVEGAGPTTIPRRRYPDGTYQGPKSKYASSKPSVGILPKKKEDAFQRGQRSLSSLPKAGKGSAKVAERCETQDDSGRPGFETRTPHCHPLF